MNDMDSVKGQKFNINGADSLTLRDMLNMIESGCGKGEGSTGLKKCIGLSEHIEEFFVGIAHDRNLARMASFYNTHQPDMRADDFFAKFNLTHSESFKDYFKKV
jgi:hypothetical protein